MSKPFSDTTNLHGLMQNYEKEIGADYGFVSGNQTRRREFTSKTRSAWDMYIYLAIKASGTWQFDDSNHTKFNFIKTDLVAGQRDYTFTTDEQGNLILDIYKVAVLKSATDTLYEEIYPVDQQTKDHAPDMVAENTTQGIPYQYDKTANGIFLDPPSSYSVTNGLKVYINREASYFSESDTTKMPGCPSIHHDYFYLRPAMEYARRNSLDNFNLLREAVMSYEGDEENGVTGSIERYFSRRQRDERKIMRPKLTKFI